MADQEKVASETIDENALLTDPGIVIGWNSAGKFLWGTPCGLNSFQILALLKKAELEVIASIPADKPKPSLVVGARGVPPPLNGNSRLH